MDQNNSLVYGIIAIVIFFMLLIGILMFFFLR